MAHQKPGHLQHTGPLLIFGVFAAASLFHAISARLVYAETKLWDLGVYQGAASAQSVGEAVYGQGFPDLSFIYPPGILWLFGLLGDDLSFYFLGFYAAALGLSLALAPQNLRLSVLLYFGVFAFAYDPLIAAIQTGNVSVFLTLLILVFWRISDKLGPWPLAIVIAIAACLKPQYLAFVALWPLSGQTWTVPRAPIAIALGLPATLWAAQWAFAPDAFRSFLTSLDSQLGMSTGNADLGLGLFAYLFERTGSATAATLGHVVAWVALAALWFGLLRTTRTSLHVMNDHRHTCIQNGAFILTVFASPRLKIYDTGVLALIAVELLLLWSFRVRHIGPILGAALIFTGLAVYAASPDILKLNPDAYAELTALLLLPIAAGASFAILRSGPSALDAR